MSTRWTEEEEHLLRLLLPTNSHQEISEEFQRRVDKKIPGFFAERSTDAVRKKCERDNLTPDTATQYKDPYKSRWDQIREINNEYKLAHEDITTGLVGEENIARKILCLSDIHFPFAREDELERAVEEHSDADIVVLNGDILDGYIFSTFPKSHRIAALAEYRAAFNFVQILSENFPKVVLVEGNHDARPARALGRANFEQEATQILRPNLIARIANGEELDEFGELVDKHDFDNVIFQQSESWWVRIGKTIFCHPHGWGGNAPGATVVKVDQQMRERFGSKEYDSIVCGHTHRIYKGVHQNRLLIEQGSMCARQDYENKANLKMAHSMNGYCVVYQDEHGNTDFNFSGPVYLGSELPPKKRAL